jgi:hypothetical protein
MSVQSSFSKTAIALFIVGLIAGAGGGYFTASNTFQQKIKEYEAMTWDMEQTLTVYEYDLTEAIKTILVMEEEIETLIQELAEFKKQEGAYITPGYNKYSLYDFSFEFPQGWTVYFMEEVAPTEDMGMVNIYSAFERGQFQLIWSSPPEEQLPLNLTEGLDSNFDYVSWYCDDVDRGNIVSTTINDHELIYQDYTGTEYDEPVSGAVALWYCDVSENGFLIIHMTHEQDGLQSILQFIETFTCH